ncbi:MAG: hypothetical protein PVJ76_11615 [Gemmatimonadota bacterium]|jgi:hypothetical protein
MDELLRPHRAGQPADPEPTESIDPFLARRVERRPWELRAAQWRAWGLAEMAFGEDVEVCLAGRPGSPTFRGFLYISVPFLDLCSHNQRQSLFLAWAGDDPVLRRVPLVFVFEPKPVAEPGPRRKNGAEGPG